jgi:hypothetical protein
LGVRGISGFDDFWDGFVDTGGEYVAVLKGYLDASTRFDDDNNPDAGGLLSVSVYLMESKRVRRFKQRWRDTFGDEEAFSWADLIARQYPFDHLTDRNNEAINREHDRLVRAGVSLVRDFVISGSIASIWMQDVKHYGPTWIKGFGHAYSVAGHMAMWGLGTWAKRNNYRGGIEYVIEAGDDGYDELAHLLSYAGKSKEVTDGYQWNGHSTAPKKPCSPFHAPDLFAWEWGKYWKETVYKRIRPMRRSLVGLLVNRLDSYTVMHLGGDSLLRFFKQINDLGVEQMQEDGAAASSVPVMNVGESIETSAQIEPVGDRD